MLKFYPCTIKNDLTVRTESHVCDSLFIETSVQNFNTKIGVIYKPPNSNVEILIFLLKSLKTIKLSEEKNA